MRSVPAPRRNLVLRDLAFPEQTLTVAHSNQGDPFRETIRFTFERNASGSYERYEHLASVELEPHEVDQLRDLLNERAKGRLR